jgi:hypothetical protein
LEAHAQVLLGDTTTFRPPSFGIASGVIAASNTEAGGCGYLGWPTKLKELPRRSCRCSDARSTSRTVKLSMCKCPGQHLDRAVVQP